MEDVHTAIDIGRETLLTAVKLATPALLTGLIAGVLVSILQAATQIQEQTLGLVPKMFVVIVTLFIIMPWLLYVLISYTEGIFKGMINWFP